jgi:archaellum biogenesis ATPase FlaH
MEKRGLPLAEIQEVPKGNLILLTGPPGAGKSAFCYQVVLNGLAMEKPVIYYYRAWPFRGNRPSERKRRG